MLPWVETADAAPFVCPGDAFDMGEEKVKGPVPLVLPSGGVFIRLSAVLFLDPPLDGLLVGVKPKLIEGATTGSVNSVDNEGAST